MRQVKYLFLISFLAFSLTNANADSTDGVGISGILDRIISFLDKFDQDRIKFDGILERVGLKPVTEAPIEENSVNID